MPTARDGVEDVQRLLRAIDVRGQLGRRDFSMLLMMATYGMLFAIGAPPGQESVSRNRISAESGPMFQDRSAKGTSRNNAGVYGTRRRFVSFVSHFGATRQGWSGRSKVARTE